MGLGGTGAGVSSPPEPRTFEGWIGEEWPGATRRPDVMAVLEPYREAVQYALDDFDDETQSWRDQCGRIYGWGPKPHNEGAVPYAIQDKVSEMMSREPVTAVDSAAPAPDLDAWRAEAGACAPLAAAAPIGPWEFGEREGGFGGRWVTTQDANHCIIQLPEGAGPFIAAARTGWPRDASRVAVLADRVAALEAALLDAAAFIEPALGSTLPFDDLIAASRKVDALRALAAGGAPKGESR